MIRLGENAAIGSCCGAEMSWYTRPWLFCIPLQTSGSGSSLFVYVTRYVCVSKLEVLVVLLVACVLFYRIVRRR